MVMNSDPEGEYDPKFDAEGDGEYSNENDGVHDEL